MSNVEKLYTAANPDHVLEQAVGNFESVIILGYGPNGDLSVRTDSSWSYADILWAIEQLKMFMLASAVDYEEE